MHVHLNTQYYIQSFDNLLPYTFYPRGSYHYHYENYTLFLKFKGSVYKIEATDLRLLMQHFNPVPSPEKLFTILQQVFMGPFLFKWIT